MYAMIDMTTDQLEGDFVKSAQVAPDHVALYVTDAKVDAKAPTGSADRTAVVMGGGARYKDSFMRFPDRPDEEYLCYVGNLSQEGEGDYDGLINNTKVINVFWRRNNSKPFTKLGRATWVRNLSRDAVGQPRYLLKFAAPTRTINEWKKQLM